MLFVVCILIKTQKQASTLMPIVNTRDSNEIARTSCCGTQNASLLCVKLRSFSSCYPMLQLKVKETAGSVSSFPM